MLIGHSEFLKSTAHGTKMNPACVLWTLLIVDIILTLVELVTVIGAQNPHHTGYLNQQPIEKVIDQGDVEKDNFVLYFPSDPKVLDRLEEAANNHPTGYGDEPPENELPNQPLQEQEETKDSQPSEVNQWEGSHEQEVNPIESKSRFQDLIRRINLSNSGLPLEKMQLYELSDPVKMRKSATTTARPIYDQIPRPLLYNNGREADSFR